MKSWGSQFFHKCIFLIYSLSTYRHPVYPVGTVQSSPDERERHIRGNHYHSLVHSWDRHCVSLVFLTGDFCAECRMPDGCKIVSLPAVMFNGKKSVIFPSLKRKIIVECQIIFP